MTHTTDLETRVRVRNRALIGIAIVVALLINPVLGLVVAAVFAARAIQRRRKPTTAPETPVERYRRIEREF